jgi:thiamine kinase-like enzyme
MVPQFETDLATQGWRDLPRRTSHGDLWTKNVIPAGRGRVVLCDPDFLGLRPVAFDLGLLFAETKGDARWAEFVEGYGERAVPPDELLEVGLRVSALNWAIYVLERCHDWAEYTVALSKGEG